jgi:outer membrane protein TolC
MSCRGLGGPIRLAMVFLALSNGAAPPVQAQSEQPQSITLEQALAEARRANAQLPEAQFRLQQAKARVREARGQLYPRLSIDGDLHGGAPQAYTSNDAMARVLVQTPLYAGGELRAGIERSQAETDSFAAGYRVSVREVDLAVRVAYGRILRDEAILVLLNRGIDRLQMYDSAVRARQVAGQGIGADALRTKERIASALADLTAVKRALDEGRMTLNDLLGREPETPLSLVSLPDPAPSVPRSEQPWLEVPEIAKSEAEVRASQAGVQAARAGHRLHVTLEADAGTQQSWGPNLAPLNNGTGSGGQVLLNFSVPFWDNGIFRARMDEAHAALNEAEQHKIVVERAARLAWSQAVSNADQLYAEYDARRAAATSARDAYLQTESLYRGGQGTALEVLDAYDAWIQTNQMLLDVVYQYRVAQANLDRWGAS